MKSVTKVDPNIKAREKLVEYRRMIDEALADEYPNNDGMAKMLEAINYSIVRDLPYDELKGIIDDINQDLFEGWCAIAAGAVQ